MPLSYFEHGLCLWSVAGELPAACRCPWDSVGFAGIWLPDAETLESARNYGGRTRRHFMRKRARQACDAYTQWCNGEVYGYEIERVTVCPCCDEERRRRSTPAGASTAWRRAGPRPGPPSGPDMPITLYKRRETA